jgi:hypothetical protein
VGRQNQSVTGKRLNFKHVNNKPFLMIVATNCDNQVEVYLSYILILFNKIHFHFSFVFSHNFAPRLAFVVIFDQLVGIVTYIDLTGFS